MRSQAGAWDRDSKTGQLGGFTEEARKLLDALRKDPAALVRMGAMVSAQIGIRKVGCKLGMAWIGAVLSIADMTAMGLEAYAVKRILDDCSSEAELKGEAGYVAEYFKSVMADITIEALLSRIKCFPAGTQIVVGVLDESDSSLSTPSLWQTVQDGAE